MLWACLITESEPRSSSSSNKWSADSDGGYFLAPAGPALQAVGALDVGGSSLEVTFVPPAGEPVSSSDVQADDSVENVNWSVMVLT